MVIAGLDVPNFYCWGVFGSLAVEVGAAMTAMASNDGDVPAKYRKKGFLFTRLVFAFMAGAVPFALDAQNIWSAIWLGASAPLVFDRAARGLDPQSS